MLEEIQRAGCNGAACHAQMYIMGTVLRHGSTEQKQRYLPQHRHRRAAPAGLRRHRADQRHRHAGLRTTAVKKDNSTYVVNGQKVWTSRAEHSDLMLLLARTTPREQTKKRTEGLSVFLVDMRAALGKGLTIRPIRTMMNHNSTEVFFDNMEVPAENLIGEEGQGFRYILGGMNAERVLIASECIGDAAGSSRRRPTTPRSASCSAGRSARTRACSIPIARAYAQTEAADLMVRKAAALFEADLPCGAEANMAKMLASEAAWAAADMCVQTHGGFGFAEEYDIERKFRETRLYMVAPISTNMILNFVSEHVLGLPRSY